MRSGQAKTTAFAVALVALSASLTRAQQDVSDPDTGPAARCIAALGAPNAGTPVSRAALRDYLGALSRARSDCAAAAKSDAPDPHVLFHLGVIRQRQGRHADAARMFERAAQDGIAAALTKLGDYRNFGTGGVAQNVERAVALYRQAAQAGDAPGMTTLAIMYRLGRGVPQDHARALELLERAARQGYHFAQITLARLAIAPKDIPDDQAAALGLPDPRMAVDNYGKAALQGNMQAALELASLYADDGRGVDANPNLHTLWTRRAAEAGHPESLKTLALMHEMGRGVAYDPARAAQLFVQALETGEVDAASLREAPGLPRRRWDRQTAIEFQTILIERGLYRGPLDGIVGPGTLAGARRLGG